MLRPSDHTAVAHLLLERLVGYHSRDGEFTYRSSKLFVNKNLLGVDRASGALAVSALAVGSAHLDVGLGGVKTRLFNREVN